MGFGFLWVRVRVRIRVRLQGWGVTLTTLAQLRQQRAQLRDPRQHGAPLLGPRRRVGRARVDCGLQRRRVEQRVRRHLWSWFARIATGARKERDAR